MKLVDIQKGTYWEVSVFGRSLVKKVVFLKMNCDEPLYSGAAPEGISLVPMDEQMIELAEQMKYYRVKKFYREDSENFYGLAAVREGRICGFVCGRKEKKMDQSGSAAHETFYLKFVYVAPESRGTHLSAYMIRRLAEELRLPFHLKVRENNAPAIRIYRMMGFYFVSRKETLYLSPLHKGIALRRMKMENT